VKFGNYCHTLHKLKGTILFDGHLKPFSVLSDDNLVIDGTRLKLIVHGYSWDLNRGTYDIEAVEFTEETIVPVEDSSSAHPSSFDIPVGGFYVNLYPAELLWAWDDLSTQTFMVYTNMPQWFFQYGDTYTEGFIVTVWDATNTVQITNFVYTSNMIVRVTPIENNIGTINLHAYIYIANSYNEKMLGGEMICTQGYEGVDTPPTVNGFVGDSMFTLGTFDHSLNTADTSLMIMWTPTAVDGSLPADFPVYITVTRDGNVIANAQYPHNTEGVMRSMWIILNEAAIAAATYQVRFDTSLA
jgi:hypothetical protein